jgi:transposase-like protein
MHRNAPLTPEGRLRLCRLIEDGWTVASAAESMRISRQTAHKWWRRYQEAGEAGLVDRSSRPRRCPTKTPHAWHRELGSQPRHCTASGPATVSRDSLTSSVGPAGSCAGSRRIVRASSSMSTSRSRPRSRRAAVGESSPRANFVESEMVRAAGPALATPSSTPPSMRTPAWPTRRSMPTSGPSPPLVFGAGPS